MEKEPCVTPFRARMAPARRCSSAGLPVTYAVQNTPPPRSRCVWAEKIFFGASAQERLQAAPGAWICFLS